MQPVSVKDKNKMPLMPCHPAGARELWRKGKAAVDKRCPFRNIFKEKSGGDVQDLQLKLDPGGKTTTMSLVAECQQGRKVVWAGGLTHRGQAIRHTLLSRVDNVFTWAKRPISLAPVSGMVVDLCKRFINILAQAKAPLKDGGASNSIRYASGGRLKAFGLRVSFWSGGRSRYYRTNQSYGKSHWFDAVCVGATGGRVYIPPGRQSLHVSDAGRVSVRKSGSFNSKTEAGTIQGISWKHCSLLQRADGYNYYRGDSVSSST
jgi:hypothetical protein